MSPRVSSQDFMDRYREAITSRGIRVGCSFAPEQFTTSSGDDGAFALQALRVAVDEYRVSDVRIGLRWNNLAPGGTQITSYYDRLLDFCFASPDVRDVCIDLGPIKTFRWPEVHVPEMVLSALRSLPSRRAAIEADSELAQVSLRHFERALRYVGERYDGRTGVSFCFNEAFHSFGDFGWTMSEGYLLDLIRLVEQSGLFPGSGYLINSAGGRQLERIADFFEDLVHAEPSLAGRLTSGFDLYPFLPPLSPIPVLREALDLVREGWRRTHMRTAANIRRAIASPARYRIEVTEAQTEPWGGERTVGNSLWHYERVLAESIDEILSPDQTESVIRMWGIEYQLERVLTRTGVPANQAILDLTREINALVP